MDSQNKTPKKPLIFYYLIAMLVLMLLNALLFPALLQTSVTEVGYNEFLSMVDDGKVEEVARDDTEIVFTAKDENGKESYYKTGIWPDDSTLTQRLEKAGVKFTAEIPQQNSPLLNFILTWIFPIVVCGKERL